MSYWCREIPLVENGHQLLLIYRWTVIIQNETSTLHRLFQFSITQGPLKVLQAKKFLLSVLWRVHGKTKNIDLISPKIISMHFLCNVRLGNGRIQVQKYRGKMFPPCSVDTWMRGQCYVQYLIPRPSIKSHLNENNKSKSLTCWESSCCFGLQWANDQLTLKRGYKMVKSEPRPTIANNRLTIKKLKWGYPYFWSILFRQKTKKEIPADSVDWAI